MDLKEKYLKNPLDTNLSYNYAESLFIKNDHRTLESYFRSVLGKTTNLKIWSLYLKYVVQYNPGFVIEAYTFTLSKIWFLYDIYPILKDFIALLKDDTEHIRKIYLIGLSNPIHELSTLFKEYEQWEMGMNRTTYKILINDKIAIYQSSYKLYQKIKPYFNDCYKLIDLETDERRQHIVNYYKEKYYYKEEIYFVNYFYNQNREALIEGIANTNSEFLKLYVQLKYPGETPKDCDFSKICYLNVTAKAGLLHFIDALRNIFKSHISDIFDNETSSGGHKLNINEDVDNINDEDELLTPTIEDPEFVLEDNFFLITYAARLYYTLSKNVETTLKIYSLGVNKSDHVNEDLVDFLIEIKDVPNLRLLFKTLNKSGKMHQKYLDFEFNYGSIDLYDQVIRETTTNSYSIYEKIRMSLGGMGLNQAKDEILEEFSSVIPKLSIGSLFNCLNVESLVDILQNIEV